MVQTSAQIRGPKPIRPWTAEAPLQTQGLARSRSRQPPQWEGHKRWREYDGTSGDAWFGFEAVRDIVGLPPELLIIPIAGHSAGHLGVAVDGPKGWMFHVGDAYYHPNQLTGGGPAGMRWLARSVDHDYAAAEANRGRLLALMRSNLELDIFCAHDPAALDRLAV